MSFQLLPRFFLVVAFLLLAGERQVAGYAGPADTTDVPGWKEMTTVDDVWRVYPGRLRTLFGALELSRPELQWTARVVKEQKGQEEPHYQGWYSTEYGVKEAAPTVVYQADEVEGPMTFAWALVPAKGTVSEVRAGVIRQLDGAVQVRVETGGVEPVIVTVPLGSGSAGPSVGGPRDEAR